MTNGNLIKYLICGLGSIGKRHCENLLSLGVKQNEIAILRRQNSNPFGDVYLKEKNFQVFTDLKKALSQKPDAVFITNPTSLHISVALESVKAGCHIFIEKPLSHSLKKVERLVEEAKKRNLVGFVGYQLRFHPLLKKIRQWLNEEKIGRITSVRLEMADQAAKWHPWEDPKISYAFRKDLGGGAIATLSHEIDLLYFLFGKPKFIFAAGGKYGSMKTDVEDAVESIMEYRQGFHASVQINYLETPPRRFIRICGEKGTIILDLLLNEAKLEPLGGKAAVLSVAGFEKNQMYLAELRHFLDCIKKRKSSLIDLQQGKDVLEIILAIKTSMEKQRPLRFL